MNSLLRIVVGEQEFSSKSCKTYNWIKDILWKEGFPGLTIRRGELSLDYKSIMHSAALEDIEFNNLAIIIESIADDNKIEKLGRKLLRIYHMDKLASLEEWRRKIWERINIV